MRNRRQLLNRGLSLLEVMLVVVLISIIASLIMSRMAASTDSAKCRSCQHNRSELNAAIERYGVENGAYPTSLGDLNAPNYFPGGIPTCPVSGAAYSMNTTIHRVEGHTSSTVPGDH
jgi:prepilin-type N-terminal cleavage/methylation domain-containing protein